MSKFRCSGHLWFIDHVDITYKGYAYVVLVILDAASNLLIVQTQSDKKENTSTEALKLAFTGMECATTQSLW